MRKILLTGYYGMGNFGDDLFARISSLALQRYWMIPSAGIRVLPNYAASDSKANSIAARMYTSQSSYAAAARRLCLMYNVALADYVLFAGGSLFSSRNSLLARRQAIRFGRRLGVRFAAIGVSLGPLMDAGSTELLSDIVRELEFVSVRDESSARLLEESGSPVSLVRSSDLAGVAVALGYPCNVPRSETITVVPMNARNSTGHILSQMNCLLVATCKAAKTTGRTLDVLCVNSGRINSDQQVYRDWIQFSRQRVRTTQYIHTGVMSTWKRVAEAGCLVTYRLHPAIVAYLCGVPFVLIDYHQKCRSFLDMIGYPNELRISPDDTPRMVDAVVHALAVAGERPNLLPVADYVRIATRNFLDVPWRANER